MKKSIVLVLLATVFAGSALAQQAPKPGDLIKWRQAAYSTMSWNMGRIKANIEGQFNKDEVVKAATVIQAIANSGMGALYAPGTDKGAGFHETKVKPEMFTDKDGAAKVAIAFNQEANEMAKVAATGDAAAAKLQFGKLGETCKGCHDKFKQKD